MLDITQSTTSMVILRFRICLFMISYLAVAESKKEVEIPEMGWMIKAMQGLQSTFDGLTNKMNKEDYEIAEVDYAEQETIKPSPWSSEWKDHPSKKNEVQNKLKEIIQQANGMMENFKYLTKGKPKPRKAEEPNEEIKR